MYDSFALCVLCNARLLTRRNENLIILEWYTHSELSTKFNHATFKNRMFDTKSWNYHARDTITDDDLSSFQAETETETETDFRTLLNRFLSYIYARTQINIYISDEGSSGIGHSCATDPFAGTL